MKPRKTSETIEKTTDKSAVQSVVPGSGFVVAEATAAGGAAAGSLGGPIGAAVGAVVGAVAGGSMGMALGHVFNPAQAEAYWREQHGEAPASGESFNDFLGAYQSGYETYFAAPEKSEFDDEIAHERYQARGGHLAWEHARPTALVGWQQAHPSK